MSKNTNTFLVIRHGETEWNRQGKIQGFLDSPLTKLGIAQARAAAKSLKGFTCHALYSSDLSRAIQTAAFIASELQVKVTPEARLRERNLGVMQGLSLDEIKIHYPEVARKFIAKDLDYVFPGGESFRQTYERSVAIFKEIAANHQNEQIVVVTHGGILDNLFRMVLNIPLNIPRKYSLKNTSINKFSVTDGEWRLETWGDVHHLENVEAMDDI